MLDVALVAVGAAVPVLPAAWILCCLWIIWIILFLHSSRTRAFSSFFVCPILWSLKNSQEYQTSLQCSVSLRIHMDILFSSTRYGNEFLPAPSLTPQSIFFSTKHGVNENYCATIMRSWVVIAIALWCHGWVELIKGIKGDHCCCRRWLCKIRAGW